MGFGGFCDLVLFRNSVDKFYSIAIAEGSARCDGESYAPRGRVAAWWSRESIR
jgi:hypothetical protein